MFVVGGSTCLSGVWTTQATSASRLGQGIVAGALLLLGLVVAALPPSIRVARAAVLLGIVLISALIAVSDPLGMAPFFYLWPLVFAAYFLPSRFTAAAFGLMVATLAIGLAINDDLALRVDTFTGTTASVGLMAAVVAGMTRRERDLRARLELAAHTDPLTALLNRRAFDPALERLLARARSVGGEVSVVLFDLDHFKRFNDEHGHLAGDEALRRLAGVLRDHAEDGDLVSRFGGEEFAVALAGAGIERARAYTAAVASGLSATEIAPGARCTVSAGICVTDGRAESVTAVLVSADAALYAAKERGRDRTGWWEGDTIVDGGSRMLRAA